MQLFKFEIENIETNIVLNQTVKISVIFFLIYNEIRSLEIYLYLRICCHNFLRPDSCVGNYVSK